MGVYTNNERLFSPHSLIGKELFLVRVSADGRRLEAFDGAGLGTGDVGTLQQVTDEGNTTTDTINVSAVQIANGLNGVRFNVDEAGLLLSSGYAAIVGFDKATGFLYLQSSVSSGLAGQAASYGTQQFTVKPDGGLRFNNYGDNFFTGTPTRALAIDTNGNVIEIPVPGASNSVTGEEFTGSTSLTLTLSQNYTAGTIKLFKNGARLRNEDFTEATANTITLNVARLAGDVFQTDFNY